MLEHLPPELRDGLIEAQKMRLRKKSRLSLQCDGRSIPVLRRWQDGFALDTRDTVHLRGLVDLYEGPNHVMQCLIVASEIEEDELICTVKSSTRYAERPPVDFELNPDAPVGLLTQG